VKVKGNNTARWMAIIASILVVLASQGITFPKTNVKKITEHDKSLTSIETELKYMNKKLDAVK
jgi:hypothetical protein